jgi:hypothetical protein
MPTKEEMRRIYKLSVDGEMVDLSKEGNAPRCPVCGLKANFRMVHDDESEWEFYEYICYEHGPYDSNHGRLPFQFYLPKKKAKKT